MIEKPTVKNLLADSLIELSKDQSLQEITVTDISRNCGLSQRTFYNHFKDKDDLVFWIYSRFEDTLIEKIDKNYSWRNALFETLHFFRSHKRFFHNAFVNTYGYNSFRETAMRHNFEAAEHIIRKKVYAWPLSEDVRFQLKLYLYGANSMTYDWVVNGMKEDPEQFGKNLLKSMPHDIQQALLN